MLTPLGHLNVVKTKEQHPKFPKIFFRNPKTTRGRAINKTKTLILISRTSHRFVSRKKQIKAVSNIQKPVPANTKHKIHMVFAAVMCLLFSVFSELFLFLLFFFDFLAWVLFGHASCRFSSRKLANKGQLARTKKNELHKINLIWRLRPVASMSVLSPSIIHWAVLSFGSRIPGLTARSWSCK